MRLNLPARGGGDTGPNGEVPSRETAGVSQEGVDCKKNNNIQLSYVKIG